MSLPNLIHLLPQHPPFLRSVIQENPWANTRYVYSGYSQATDTANDGYSPNKPYATLAQALTDASAHDKIIIHPEHTETIATANGLNPTVDGLSVVGLGRGSVCPTFTFDTIDTADLQIDGDGFGIVNCNFACGKDGLNSLITVSGASARILACEFTGDASFQCDTFIAAAGSVDCIIDGCTMRSETPGATSAVSCSSAARLGIYRNTIEGDYSSAPISNSVSAMTLARIVGNDLHNLNANNKVISGVSTCTGLIAYNTCYIHNTTDLTWIDAADFRLFENYGVNQEGEYGILFGTPSS